MFALKRLNKPTSALPDLLMFERVVAPGVVATRGGGYIAGWYFRGADVASSTPAEREYVSGRVNAALARLGNGWTSWFDAARIPAPSYVAATPFPDAVSALIEAERRDTFTASGAFYECEYALIVMYQPPRSESLRLDTFLYDDDQAIARDPETQLMRQLEAALSEIEDFIGATLNMRRMRGYQVTLPSGHSVLRDDLVNYLHYTVTGLIQPINLPPCPMYLEGVISTQELVVGDTPRVGELFVGVVAVDGLPAESFPNCLDALNNLPMPYRWSTRFIFMDQPEAVKNLEAIERKWTQKVVPFIAQMMRSPNPTLNEDALQMAKVAAAATADAHSGLVTFGYLSATVVIHAPTRAQLDEWCAAVVREVRRVGFGSRRETINTVEAWLGSVPGHPEANIRRPLVHTLNLADLAPLASVWPGHQTSPSPLLPANSPALLQAATQGSTPFRLNLHVGDVGHTLVFGPTGAGKSTLLALICAQFRRYPRARVIVFDVKRSMMPLCLALGGHHYDLSGEGTGIELAPLADVETENDLAWACDWIAGLYELQQSVAPTPRQREEIFRAMCHLRGSVGKSLTDLAMTVQDEALRAALTHYTVAGAMGHLLDGRSEGLRPSPFTVFEIEDLMSLTDKNAVPVLTYLFRRVEKSVTGEPTLLVIDEGWLVLGHPAFRSKLRAWLKTMRSKNVSVVFATQQISDAARSGIFDVLIESCPTKILLPNEEAELRGTPETPGPRDIYESVGLNAVEIRMLATAQKKRHYYYTSPEGRRLFDLALGPIALSFCGVSDRESLNKVAAFAELHGEAWPFAWLEHRGVRYDHLL